MVAASAKLVPAGAHPGSVAAYRLGCSCPVEANNGGAGTQERVDHRLDFGKRPKSSFVQTFWMINPDCTVHAPCAPAHKK